MEYINFTWALAAQATLLGVVLGSFLNVVIYRLPKMIEASIQSAVNEHMGVIESDNSIKMSLSFPASSCTSCGHVIKWYENIPVISYLVQKGKCSDCGSKISIRYPIVELLSGVISFFIFMKFGLSLHFFVFLLFSLSLIAIAYIDFDHMIVPDEIVQPLLWIGLVYGLYYSEIGIYQSLMGAVIGYSSLYVLNKVMSFFLRVDEAIGAGDFKLMAASGAFLGLSALTSIALIASIVFLASAILIKKKGAIGEQIPFGPAISASSIAAIFFVNDVKQIFVY